MPLKYYMSFLRGAEYIFAIRHAEHHYQIQLMSESSVVGIIVIALPRFLF